MRHRFFDVARDKVNISFPKHDIIHVVGLNEDVSKDIFNKQNLPQLRASLENKLISEAKKVEKLKLTDYKINLKLLLEPTLETTYTHSNIS